jgi:stress-induced morphogen
MPIAKSLLEDLLHKAFPNSEIEVLDLVGDNDHYEVKIISEKFTGMNLLAQHRLVYKCLSEHVGHKLHALTLKTKAKN